MYRVAWLVSLIACAGSTSAHHGPPVEPLYDTQNVVMLDGVVTELLWRNPHVRFRIEVTKGSRAGEIWEVEMDPLTRMRRTGLSPDFVKPGDIVKVAGIVARHKPRVIALENLLLPDGQEYVGARLQAPLRFGGERLAADVVPIDPEKIEAAAREADGLFRTWARVRGHGSTRLADEALTEEGRRAKAAFDRMADEPLLKPLIDIPKMADIACEMLDANLDAFIKQKPKAAKNKPAYAAPDSPKRFTIGPTNVPETTALERPTAANAKPISPSDHRNLCNT